MSDQYVADDERDAILDRLLTVPDNKVCFDCKSKNPKWASSNIGIFLCYQCTSIHRNYGVHISFVRSLKMDRWKLKELKQMELGGNKNAAIFFEKNGMYQDGKPNHKATQLTKYKTDLLKRVELEIGQLKHMDSATFNVPTPSSQLQQASTFKPAAILDFDNPQVVVSKSIPLEETKEQVPLPLKAQKNSMQPQSSSNLNSQASGGFGLAFGKAPVQAEVKTLNAKKLDVNFDNDDFFNSFEPTTTKPALVKEPSFGVQDKQSKFVSSSKLQEVNDDEIVPQSKQQQAKQGFAMGQQLSFGGSSSAGSIAGVTSSNSASDEIEAQQRLRAMGNKKGISSEELFGKQEVKSTEVVQRYQQLQGAKAISSDMFFNNATNSNGVSGNANKKDLGEELEGHLMGRSSMNSNNSYDEYKEQAAKMAERVQEGAKVLKDKALDWLSAFTS